MSTTTDVLGLNTTNFFEKIRAGLPTDVSMTQNLMDSKDDLLFAWDSKRFCLLVLNWRATTTLELSDVTHQELFPSYPLNYRVERILMSIEGSLIAVAGPGGLSIFELPRRWGRNGQFMGGKESITCRSFNIDEDFFLTNSRIELLQIKWHPGSTTDSHLLALYSDNTIRVYDDMKLMLVWRVGLISHGPLPNLESLGDTAVDFDFAPPRVSTAATKPIFINDKDLDNTNNNKSETSFNNENLKSTLSRKLINKVEWPIIILRGDGNVYMMCASMDTRSPFIQGPLTMKPQTDDNYGTDSCSILVIPSLPPTVVIAESTGKLHHCILMKKSNVEQEEEETFTDTKISLFKQSSEWSLYVIETVKLELGLQKNYATNSHYCPIHLQRDYINEIRYFAYHNTGLHVTTINFIKELQAFVDSDVPSNVPTFSVNSQSEYVLCTKSEQSNLINSVLGFVSLQLPSNIVLLLSSGQVISLKLIIDTNVLNDWNVQTDSNGNGTVTNDSPLQKIINEPFVTVIKNMLKRNVRQPILSINKNHEPTPHEAYETATQAIEVLRTEYIEKQAKVKIEISKRIKICKMLTDLQQKEIELLEQEKTEIRESAYRLAERYEEVNDKQIELTKQLQQLVRTANITVPSTNTMAENDFAKKVSEIEITTKKLAKNLNKSREELAKQQYHIKKYKDTNQTKKYSLPIKQSDAIGDILKTLHAEIEDQINDVKTIAKLID